MQLWLAYSELTNTIYAVRTDDKWKIKAKADVTEEAVRFILLYGIKNLKEKDVVAFSHPTSDYMIQIIKKPEGMNTAD